MVDDRRLQIGRGQDVMRADGRACSWGHTGRSGPPSSRGRCRCTGSALRCGTGRNRLGASFSGCGTSLMSLWQATQSRAAWGDAFKAAALKPGGTPAWRLPDTRAGIMAAGTVLGTRRLRRLLAARDRLVRRVAIAASRSRFTAVMVWYFSTNCPLRSSKTGYKDLSILYCAEICVKL